MKNKLGITLGFVGIVFIIGWTSALSLATGWFPLSGLGYSFEILSDLSFLPLQEQMALIFPFLILFEVLEDIFFFILPILLFFIGVVKSGRKPVMSGILLLLSGSLFLYRPFLCLAFSDIDYFDYCSYFFDLIPSLLLLGAGFLILIRNKTK